MAFLGSSSIILGEGVSFFRKEYIVRGEVSFLVRIIILLGEVSSFG